MLKLDLDPSNALGAAFVPWWVLVIHLDCEPMQLPLAVEEARDDNGTDNTIMAAMARRQQQ